MRLKSCRFGAEEFGQEVVAVPNRASYVDLTLAEAVRQLAERHYEQRTRHISADEYQMLLRAAEVLDRGHAQLSAFRETRFTRSISAV